MKFALLIALFFTLKLNGQTLLNFNKKFVESENHWVAFKTAKDSIYKFGYVYVDPYAGFTLKYEGTFGILPNGTFTPSKKEETSIIKIRLQPNNILVAFIPESKFQELKIDTIPDWIKFFKMDTNSVAHLYKRGFFYNGFGEYEKALIYLNKAEKLNPKFKGLGVELAFSYNALLQYKKAEDILEKTIAIDSTDAYVNKEYIYALCKNNKIENAIKQFGKSKDSVKDKQYDAENCYNILQYFFYKKDHANFDKWCEVLQKQPNQSDIMTKSVENMKKLINQ